MVFAAFRGARRTVADGEVRRRYNCGSCSFNEVRTKPPQ